MGTILDLILVAVIIIVIALAAKRGVITTVVEVVAFVLALFVASSAAQPVAEIMYKSFFFKSVQKGIYDSLPANPSTLNFAQKAEIVLDNIPEFAKTYAEKSGLNIQTVSSEISKSGIKNDADLYKNLEEKIVKPVAVLVLKHIMFFVLSILFAIIFKLIAKAIAKGLDKFELVGAVDKVAGAVIGIAEGAVIVFLVCCLLTYLKPKYENPKMIEAVNDSSIVSFAENFDPMDAITAAQFYAENLD